MSARDPDDDCPRLTSAEYHADPRVAVRLAVARRHVLVEGVDGHVSAVLSAPAPPSFGDESSGGGHGRVVGRDWRALSFLQPWPDAVLYFDQPRKTVENRVKWVNSHFRGPVLIHASQRSHKTKAEYVRALEFARRREIDWRPPPYDDLPCGGIVGIATVVGVIAGRAHAAPCVHLGSGDSERRRPLRPEEERWWMGSFALVLADARPLPFVACRGALGFFRPPPEVVAQCVAHGA